MAIKLKIPGVDFHTPPATWIARFQDGESVTQMKSSGNRKVNQKKEENVPKKDTTESGPVHLHVNMPATTPAPLAQPQPPVYVPPPPPSYWQHSPFGLQFIEGMPASPSFAGATM
ncbi:hypothetical protein ACEPPN_001343 [Leptodophora sp. 'Broadleaf-Isolate-01']